ncbi:MAG: hypothetical protein ABR987_09725 [Terracidiphilus sp.]
MRRILYFAFLASLCTLAIAQTVPPQFQNLLTTNTDYTCGGVVPCATWPMPPIPSVGGSYVDPFWGTTTYRLPVLPANNSGLVFSSYSRVQAWSSDNKRMFLTEPTSGIGVLDLYDATTTPPTPINRITTTDGTYINAMDGDAYWSNTIPTRIYYIPWDSPSKASLQLRYVDVSNCTAQNCVLTPTIVHTFSCVSDAFAPFGAGVPGNWIETGSGGQGGMFDSTDNFFSFTCDFVNGTGRGEIDFIRYERSTDTVTTQEKWYSVCAGGVPSGCRVYTNPWGKQGYDMIRMNQHPDANYITVIWQCSASNSTWSIGCGTAGYGPTYNFLGPISAAISHQDNGFDINGVPVTVFIGANTNTIADAWSIEIANLKTLSPTGITSKVIYLPCSYALRPNVHHDAGGRLGALQR